MELENIIKEMREEIDGKNRNEVLVILDQKFHNKISSISKNYLIECLFLTSSKLFEGFIKDAREKIINRYSDEKILLNQHIDIYNAIVNKDSNLAYKKMEDHMRLIKENYIK